MSKAIIIDWGSWQLNILWKSEVSKYGSNMLRLALKVMANIFVYVEMDPLGKCKGLRKLEWQPRMMILAAVSSVDKKKRKIALAKDSKEKIMIVEKQKQESLN